ncbi:hypothetical protein B0H19DRAFT_144319 [Mycena capillaripes]|nr:hypothetical protein B0H19DRAFT_144319 [Mycena capillaripes]
MGLTMSEPRRWHAASPSHFVPLRLLRPLDALSPTTHHPYEEGSKDRYRASEEDAGQPERRKDGESVATRGGGGRQAILDRAHRSARGRLVEACLKRTSPGAIGTIECTGRARHSRPSSIRSIYATSPVSPPFFAPPTPETLRRTADPPSRARPISVATSNARKRGQWGDGTDAGQRGSPKRAKASMKPSALIWNRLAGRNRRVKFQQQSAI